MRGLPNRARVLREDWEDLASQDAFWAILSDPDRRFGRWRPAEFFATGAHDVESLLRHARTLRLPKGRERALDFGCGVGRLTQALVPYFGAVVGIDISAGMVKKARELNARIANCRFEVTSGVAPIDFPDDAFDLVCSLLVLQHVPNRNHMAALISDLARVVKPRGLLVFQLPFHIPVVHRIQLRRRVYRLLRRCGLSEEFICRKAQLCPIAMSSLPVDNVVAALRRSHAELVDVEQMGPHNNLYFATK